MKCMQALTKVYSFTTSYTCINNIAPLFLISSAQHAMGPWFSTSVFDACVAQEANICVTSMESVSLTQLRTRLNYQSNCNLQTQHTRTSSYDITDKSRSVALMGEGLIKIEVGISLLATGIPFSFSRWHKKSTWGSDTWPVMTGSRL